MKYSTKILFFFIFLLNHVLSQSSIPYRNVMYYGEWSIYAGQNNFYPSKINPKLITHLNFAFLDMDSNGDLVLCDEWAEFQITSIPELDGITYGNPYAGVIGAINLLKIKNPHLKVGISVGGWIRSGDFHEVAGNTNKRANFAKNIVKFVDYIGYDFVDIDWEHPTSNREPAPGADDEGCPGGPEDTENFTLLLQALRKELDLLDQKNNRHYELTIAMNAVPSMLATIQYDKVLQIVDFANMMTYDMNGAWNSYTAHHTPLYTNEAYDPNRMAEAQFSADTCIKYFERTYGNTIDYKKINIGVAPYTRGWAGVKNDGIDPNNPGLFASADPNSVIGPDGSADGTFPFYSLDTIKQQYALEEYFDYSAKAAYYYSPTKGYFFTIDNEKSVAYKGQYVREKGLGGLIAWMASLDANGVVTKAMFNSLYGEGYVFPDDELIYSNVQVTVSINAYGSNYDITIRNTETAVESNIALKHAELIQKSILFMKLYIKTRSGAIFSAGSMSGEVTNENGIGIVDPSSNYDAQNIAPGGQYAFTVKVDRNAVLADIESVTITQRILKNLPEFKRQIIYSN